MKTLIIDSNNLCYRALIIRGAREIAGQGVAGRQREIILSVIQGFLIQLRKLSYRYGTNRFIFAFDTKPYHRTKLFPDYKSKRASEGRAKHERRISPWGPPPQLKGPIFNLIQKKVLPKIGFKNIFSKAGYEADDIIASIVQTYSKHAPYGSFVVVSSDKDLYQLLDHCVIFCFKKDEMTKDIFAREYPFPPKVWPYFRALTGDPSDSIPGIRMVGPDKATHFLTKSLGKTGKVYERITSPEGKEIVRRNLKLMTLPWGGTGTFPLKKDKLSLPALLDLANRLQFDHLLTPDKVRRWHDFFSGG
jgi:5'-3' exonuclease